MPSSCKGMSKRPWTKEEIQILKDNAGKMSSVEIGNMVGKSKQSVQSKANRLGITLDGYCKKISCMDCGTPTFVAWQANKNIRCPICREKYERQGKKIYDHYYRPEKFNQQSYGGNRHIVLERDGYKCRLCGSAQRLIIHHINEISYHNSDRPDNDPNNLTTLCKPCHTRYHASKNRSRENTLEVAK